MTAKELKQEIEDRLKVITTKAIEQRGKQLYSQGSIGISETNWGSHEIYFYAWGTHKYNMFFKIDEETLNLQMSCTCPYEQFCKHRVGALYLLLKDQDLLKILNKKISRILENKDTPNFLGAIKEAGKYIKKANKSRKKHHAGEPYLLEDIGRVSLHNLDYYGSFSSLKSTDSCETEIVEVGHLEFSADVRINHYMGRGAEEYEVKFWFQKANLLLTCDCNSLVDDLCGHAYYVLKSLLRNDAQFFTSEGLAQIENIAEKRAQNLGLPYQKSWREVLRWRFVNGMQVFEPFGKFAGALDTDSLENDPFGLLAEEEPEIELPTESANEDRYCGFYLEFSEDQLVEKIRIEALSGRAKSEDAPFSSRIKPFYKDNNSDELNYSEDELLLLGFKGKLRGAQSKFDPAEDFKSHFAQVLQVLHQYGHLLARHPRIYIYNNSSGWSGSFKKMDITQVQLHPQTPHLRVQFTEDQGFIFSKYILTINNLEYDLKSGDVSIPHYLFVRVKNHLFLHSSLRDAAAFRVFHNEANFSCSLQNFPEIVKKIWTGVARQYQIDWSGIKSFNIDEQKMQRIQKEIYLSEVGEFILIKPVALYKNKKRVNVLSRGEDIELENEKIIVLKRNTEWEQAFEEELRKLHPNFAEQRRPDFLHLKGREFLKNDWFLQIFPRLQQMGIVVYGWKDLKNLKVNPYPAKVSYQVNHETDWFETEVKVAFGDETVSLSHIKKNLTTEGYVRLKDGTMGLLPEKWLEKLQRLFDSGTVKHNKVKVPDKLFNLVDELFDKIDDGRASLFIKEKKQKLQEFDKIQPQPLPKGVKATLRHYQEDGYNWLCFLHEFQWGGILADDMGLGKTLQVITFLSYVLKENKQTNLVVVPTSLLFNWENELAKFAPDIKAHFHHGKDRVKEIVEFDSYDIVFTSYGLMTRDIEKLHEYTFNYLVLDESQAIKNAASKRYKAARLLKAQNRLALTGTPIENHTFDLFAQLSFVNPGLLGAAASFKKNYALPIDKEGDEEKAAQLQRMIRPFVLRRTKEQVAKELPDKVEDVLYCEMPAEQRKVYDAFRNKYRDLLLNKIDDEGIDKSRFSALEGLTKLRQICDTPQLLNGDEKYSSASAKIDLLLQHIREKTGQHKILVFSQFVKMLRLIEEQIKEAGISYEYLDGKSSIKQRQESVAHFQEDEECRVFLISLKAGGTGLNLMAADYVYLVDPWWNPAVENQAIDRCYRIGQDKKVIAYRMISKDTVEEKIMQLQNKKKALASDLIQTDEHVLKQLDKSVIMDLFG